MKYNSINATQVNDGNIFKNKEADTTNSDDNEEFYFG